ncbi:unnamed protein product [Adineta steineri]|uniref:ADP-ribosylglycohydrolase n=1 Tax=Adineta steineri TaxID=433720 RepID=A0A815CVH3_9BILA|nr:unnamed protein product [Adineta steineri]
MDFLSDYELLKKFNVYCSEAEVTGNGALVRLAPVPLFFYRDPKTAVEYSGQSGQTTHGDQKAYDACRYYGALIVAALQGYSKDDLLKNAFYSKNKRWFGKNELHPDVKSVAEGSYKRRNGYEDGIRGNSYIVNALEAALWAFWSDEDSFEKGALAAVNLGDDTDTTAAIYGQLAGAYYGYNKLPNDWVRDVYAKTFMEKSNPKNKTSLLSEPPTYQNPELQQMINDGKIQPLIWFDKRKLTDADMEIVAYYLLQDNKTLTQLCLSNNKIGDKGAQYLSEALQKNTTLTTLDLSYNQIGNKGVQYLGEALKKNTVREKSFTLDLSHVIQALTTLQLQNNQIGAQGSQYLVEALQTNTTLTELYLSRNAIGSQWQQHLQELTENRNLTLDLSGNPRYFENYCVIS